MRERKHVEGHGLGRWSARGEFEPLPLDLGLFMGTETVTTDIEKIG